jgi:hypothetical protein
VPESIGRGPAKFSLSQRRQMSQGKKRLEEMRRNPKGDWKIRDVEVVCRAYGVECHRPGSGSHFTVSHRSQTSILTIPSRRPLKPVYIRMLVKFIDAVLTSQAHGRS